MTDPCWAFAECTDVDGRQVFLRYLHYDTPAEAARRTVEALVPGHFKLHRIYVFDSQPFEYTYDIHTRALR